MSDFTIVGNLTADPELKFTPNGKAVVNFTVADTPRYFDKTTNEWKDGETLYMNCSLWRDAAEHVADSLTKGARVIATGTLKPRSFEAKDGTTRKVIELEVAEIGPSLRYARAVVTKVGAKVGAAPRSNGGGYTASADFGASWNGDSGADELPPF
jgi:single-strand DNA-binding protein